MNSERGNIVVYLLVGLALFGAMLGSIWWVKHRVGDSTIAPVTQSTNMSKNATSNQPDTTIDQDAALRGGSTTQDHSTEAAPSNSGQEATQPSTGSSVPQATEPPKDDTTNPAKPESQTSHVSSPSHVASSGPVEDAFGVSVLIGAVTFAAHSFVRSRRIVKAIG